jgi:hypothetical protein
MATPCEIITKQMGLLFSCEHVNGYIRVETPFLYPDGDVIDIFYKEEEETITLTDLGETMRWLKMQTVSLRRSLKQQQLIDDICLSHNILFDRGMLTAPVGSPDNLASTVVRLVQCILRVSELRFMFQNQADDLIVEEVGDFLRERHIKFEHRQPIWGRSGTLWKPDFQVRHNDQYTLIHVLSASNHRATFNVVSHVYTMWHDLSYKVENGAFQFISLFDDALDVWKKEDFRLVGAISDIAYWSRSDEFLKKVA